MKFYVIVFFICLSAIQLTAQIGGPSGSKLSAYCVDVVDHHKIEFEPAFYNFRSNSFWDGDGNLTYLYGSPDSVNTASGLNFRFTYGLWDKLEIGASISTDLETSAWGVKYILLQNGSLGLGLMAGANIPFGNGTVDNSVGLGSRTISAGAGAIASIQFQEDLSLDINAQYLAFLEETSDNHKGTFYFNSDLGYYIFSGQLQLIAGFGYQISKVSGYNSQLVTIYPGITVETGKNYILILSAPFDVYGLNADKNNGFSLALTITLE